MVGRIVPAALVVSEPGGQREFRNQRDPQGYHLEPRGGRLWIRRDGEELDTCSRLKGREYQKFAAVKNEDDLLNFVKVYGPLTPLGNDLSENGGDPAESLVDEARWMNEILSAFGRSPPYLSNQQLERLALNSGRAARSLVWDSDSGVAVWQSNVSYLLAALWEQLANAVTCGVLLRLCEYCREWFEIGTRGGKRRDARFCSDDHRIAFKNNARKQARNNHTHEQGA